MYPMVSFSNQRTVSWDTGLLVMEEDIEGAELHRVDAGGRFLTPAPVMSFFDIITSFTMISSGRFITVLGAFEVS